MIRDGHAHLVLAGIIQIEPAVLFRDLGRPVGLHLRVRQRLQRVAHELPMRKVPRMEHRELAASMLGPGAVGVVLAAGPEDLRVRQVAVPKGVLIL